MVAPLYLDHAATSCPKPAAVGERLGRYFAEASLSAGRGSYRRAELLGREISAARAALATILGAESPDRVVFTGGGTEALNLAIRGLLRPGDHVIASVLEHNSVLRPLAWLKQQLPISVSYVSPEPAGRISAAGVLRELRPETRLICCLHASNVTGGVQPVEEICQVARERGVLTLIDAAQTVGHLPLDVRAMGCDLLAAPAHKGLLAPLGVGFLYLAKGLEQRLEPLILGGTGTQSERETPPADMPGRYEAGSLNVPGLLGLAAALETVSPDYILRESLRQRELTSSLITELQAIPGLVVHQANLPADERIGVISLSLGDQDPRIVETILDSHFGIEVRSGLHCAPRAHGWLGTLEQGGTVRLSLGHTTSAADVARAVRAFRELSAA